MITRRNRFTLVLIVAFTAFVVCILLAVISFIGLAMIPGPVVLAVMFCAVLAKFGAIRLFARRTNGQTVKDWKEAMFAGVPQWFPIAYRVYFVLILAGGVAAFAIGEATDRRTWNKSLLVLLCSVSYLTSVGAYWSEQRGVRGG